jgi:hypothetical protein
MATPMPRRPSEPQRRVDPELAAFQQFLGTLAANPSVQLVATDPVGGHVNLWVRLADDNEDNETAMYAALSAYHASDGVETPIDLHVIFADEDEAAFPSGIQPLFRRPR